jgi:hypothetical protein
MVSVRFFQSAASVINAMGAGSRRWFAYSNLFLMLSFINVATLTAPCVALHTVYVGESLHIQAGNHTIIKRY